MPEDGFWATLIVAVVSSGALSALVAELLHRTRAGRQLDTARALKDQADIMLALEKDSGRSNVTGTGALYAVRLSLKKQVLNELVPPFGSLRLLFGVAVSLLVVFLGVLVWGAVSVGVRIAFVLAGAGILALVLVAYFGTAGVATVALLSMDASDRQQEEAGGTPCYPKESRALAARLKKVKSGKSMFNWLERVAVDRSVRSIVCSLALSAPKVDISSSASVNGDGALDTSTGTEDHESRSNPEAGIEAKVEGRHISVGEPTNGLDPVC